MASISRFHQSLPAVDQLGLLGCEALALEIGSCAGCLQLGLERGFELFTPVWRELDRGPVVLHHALDLGDQDGAARAANVSILPSQADEVGVDVAVAIRGDRDDEAAGAAATPDTRLQVVPVDALLLADSVAVQHVLDLMPGHLIDERFVITFVKDTLVGHEAFVVGVAQDPVEDVRRDRLAGQLGGAPCAQAERLKFVGHRPKSPLAGCVSLERPADDVRAILIDDHGADLASLVGELPDVQIPERRLAWGSAHLGLLTHALVDLGCEIVRVELRKAAEHAVHELPGRRLVDVLGRGDELGASADDAHVDVDVVLAVAREPVDLVHDHVVDLGLLDVRQHPLKVRTIRRFG